MVFILSVTSTTVIHVRTARERGIGCTHHLWLTASACSEYPRCVTRSEPSRGPGNTREGYLKCQQQMCGQLYLCICACGETRDLDVQVWKSPDRVCLCVRGERKRRGVMEKCDPLITCEVLAACQRRAGITWSISSPAELGTGQLWVSWVLLTWLR